MITARTALSCAVLLITASASAGEYEWWSEGRLRGERTENLPDGRSFDRARLHGFFGTRWFSDGDQLEIGGAIKLSAGSDSERDNVRNFDNESSDDIEIGELYVRWGYRDLGLIEAGRTRVPFRLSPMVWDDDFRPIGASIEQDWEVLGFDRIRLNLGYVAPRHIDETSSRLGGVQVSYGWQEGAAVSGSARFSYLRFDDLEEVTREGRTRTNSRGPDGLLLYDYHLLDLILESRLQMLERPLALSVNLTHNLDAAEGNDAARFSARWGDATEPGRFEGGFAYQRVQADAVMAAFNEDDWWFPTRMRGSRFWVAYGLTTELILEGSYFRERRDGLDDHVERFFLDLTWLW